MEAVGIDILNSHCSNTQVLSLPSCVINEICADLLKADLCCCIRSHCSSPTQGHCFSKFLHHQLHLVFLYWFSPINVPKTLLLTTHLLATIPFPGSTATLLKRNVSTCNLQFLAFTPSTIRLSLLSPSNKVTDNFHIAKFNGRFSVFHLIWWLLI